MERGGILFIGEAPGAVEQKKGVPFVGKTGEEVNRHYLPVAGLKRELVTLTNAISCAPDTPGHKLDPKKAAHLALLDSCANANLYPLIEQMKPRVLVPMGNFAIRAVAPHVDLEIQHGIPTTTEFGIPAFPAYHPALGLHEPKKMLLLRNDWGRLRLYLKGKLRVILDEYPNPDYQEVEDVREIKALDPTRPLAGDTESSRSGPFCLTYSQDAGTGRLIRAERVDLIQALQAQIDRWESKVIFHNWLYDAAVTENMGLRIPFHKVVDTMVCAYHLGNLPQGLKALAYRELGMRMESFDDVVRPYSTERVMEYYRAAAEETWERPEAQVVLDHKTQRWKPYKPQSMNTKFKRFFTDMSKNPDKDPFDMWETNWADSHAMIEERMGPWPGLDIRHTPFEKIVHYACRDVDALIRLWPLLKRAARMVRRFSQNQWMERARTA